MVLVKIFLLLLEKKLSSPSEGVIVQTIYAICNFVCNGEEQKNNVMTSNGILEKILQFLGHTKTDIRVAACWFCINLTCKDEKTEKVPELRLRKFVELGFHKKIREMKEENDLEIKNRILCLLENFAAVDKI